MYTITLDDLSPPPLALALNAMRAGYKESEKKVVDTGVYGYNKVFSLDIPKIVQIFGAGLSTLNAPEYITLAGQFLERYAPLIALDSTPAGNGYRNSRRLGSLLPGRVGLADIHKYRDSNRFTSSHSFSEKLAAAGRGTQRQSRIHDHTEPSIIADYTVSKKGMHMHRGSTHLLSAPISKLKSDLHATRERGVASLKFGVDASMRTGGPNYTPSPVAYGVKFDMSPLQLMANIVKYGPTRTVPASHRDHDCGANGLFDSDGAIAGDGLFFSSPTYSARLEHMSTGEFGMVDLTKLPFRITLNSNVAYPRMQMSLVHELLHVFCEMQKFNISHEQIHGLAVDFITNILPALDGLAKYTNRQLI